MASTHVRTNTGSAMSESKRRWRRTISFLLKDLSPTFNVTNLFLSGITSTPCLQRPILCLENARLHKMLNFPTLSSWLWSCGNLQNILFFPLEIASDSLQHLKKTLLKLFSCVNLFRPGSPRHSLEKNACMQIKRKKSYSALLLQWSTLDSCQQKIQSHSAWKSAVTEQTLSPYKDLKKYYDRKHLEVIKKKGELLLSWVRQAFPFMVISVKDIWHMMYIYVYISLMHKFIGVSTLAEDIQLPY